ncbi:MAG: hypothetical protein K0V04_43980 [Deltaproteobacteria bacterium]|nr:hypothetical protein [Deltaproteobacteria bacterium]
MALAGPSVAWADVVAPEGQGEAAPVEAEVPAAEAPAAEGDAPVEGDSPEGGLPSEPETTPTEEGTPTEGTPTEAGTPTEEPAPVEEPAPIEEPEVLPTDTPDEAEPVTEEAIEPEEEFTLDPRPRHRWIYSNLTALRYNPLGLVNEFTTGYRYQFIDKNSALFRDSFIAAQLHTYITPAYGRIGPKLDFQPLAILNLSATYDYTGYFGSFGLFQSFNSPTADWSDSELQRRDDANDPAIENYSTTGHWVTLSMLLQAKVKNFAVRDNLKFYWADFDLRDGDTVYYHQTLDIPQPDRGWTLTNDADLLYLFDFGLKVGVRYTLTHAFYQPRHFQASEPVSRPNGPTHRIGPAVLYTFFDRPDLRFNKPTLIVLSQWWARHRFRTGQDVSAGVPYLVIGFRFEGDLLPNPNTWNKKTEPKRKRRRGG